LVNDHRPLSANFIDKALFLRRTKVAKAGYCPPYFFAMQPILYWFRNDLRLHDNPALWAAQQTGAPIYTVFVFDELWLSPTSLGFDRCGPQRLAYWQNAVLALQEKLRAMGGDLHIFKGKSTAIIAKLSKQINASAVYASHEYAHEELEMEQAIARQLPLNLFWGNMLFLPNEMPYSPQDAPFYYTAFKNKFVGQGASRTETQEIVTLNFHRPQENFHGIDGITLQKNNHIIVDAGEEAALKRLNDITNGHLLDNYIDNRERFDADGITTLLSAHLAVGTLSARRVYNAVNATQSQQPLFDASVTKLNEQLVWRDYYRWLFLRYGKKIFRRTGLRTVTPVMYNDTEAFEKWRLGKTGQPLVDACMAELNQTGLMNNRGRMVASYYLSKVMGVNWLWGAQWFEAQLIDYDVCNNYGNWAYQSGTGTDSRINRRFNLEKQVQRFDPSNNYINHWGKGQASLF
jgi:deoxyribodipyrimidine photo-lyase